ncbi:hypothetical protein GGQ74_001262 [Desulfobaculum xiamenense]|uniref:Uncharacterized protein n=1 Tax=Desulfobaculum xiamenense TaxID=995050 RepID=A0A846QMD6_9BACT|nr:hypothetical protein [Desulfobaculum xiamenense]NJB67622.1 hypothetical protein [Desulfobaculum xiamenense]
MEQFTLKRNGKPDLVFNGAQLAQVDEREFVGFKEDWMDTCLYRTAFGQYVLSSIFHITSCGKRDMTSALVFSCAQDLLDYLEIGTRPLSPLSLELLRQASLEDEAFTLCTTFCTVRLKVPHKTLCAQ